jgi:hypothetical protein
MTAKAPTTPTKIIAVSRRRPYRIETDAGVFTKKELAAALGIAEPTLDTRIRRHGWGSEKIMWGRGEFRGVLQDQGTDEWKALGERSRKTEAVRALQLDKIKLGIYEERTANG